MILLLRVWPDKYPQQNLGQSMFYEQFITGFFRLFQWRRERYRHSSDDSLLTSSIIREKKSDCDYRYAYTQLVKCSVVRLSKERTDDGDKEHNPNVREMRHFLDNKGYREIAKA